MGYADRQSRALSHPLHTCGQLGVTSVPVTPLDPFMHPLRCVTADGWWDGCLLRLPTWTRARYGLGIVVARHVTSVPWYLARVALEVTVLAIALALVVSSLL